MLSNKYKTIWWKTFKHGAYYDFLLPIEVSHPHNVMIVNLNELPLAVHYNNTLFNIICNLLCIFASRNGKAVNPEDKYDARSEAGKTNNSYSEYGSTCEYTDLMKQ